MRLLFSLLLVVSGFSVQAKPLPLPKLSRNQVSVSGVSAGGFMAVQLDVAFSKVFSGVASFAGGIYSCAEGDVMKAQLQCMRIPSQLSSQHYWELAKNSESQGLIDPLINLKDQKVYIFNGSRDFTVDAAASVKLKEFYTVASNKNIKHDNTIPAAHGQPTLNYGNSCSIGMAPWLQNCNFDGAGAALSHIYGSLKAPAKIVAGNLQAFDQKPFAGADALMATEGYIYIPAACKTSMCKLHVALHGCQQSPDFSGDSYFVHAGYNEWAEANQIVVLYPTTKKSSGNPNACWDWWGYTNRDYANQRGPQMQAILKMVQSLTSP